VSEVQSKKVQRQLDTLRLDLKKAIVLENVENSKKQRNRKIKKQKPEKPKKNKT